MRPRLSGLTPGRSPERLRQILAGYARILDMDTVNVPVEVFDDNRLSRSAKQLLIGIMWLAAGKKQLIATPKALAVAAGFRARKTVMAHLRDLERLGWIDICPPDAATSEAGADRDTKRCAYRLSISLRNPIREEKARQIGQLETDIKAAPNKGEALMRKVLDLVIPDTEFIDNYRPEFLKNPMTGQCLEYDRYYKLGVAFEFNGPQHYGPTEKYPDRRDAAALRTRDLVKRGLSAENGITLIVVRAADLSIGAICRLAERHLPVCRPRKTDLYVVRLQAMLRRYVENSRCTGERPDATKAADMGQIPDRGQTRSCDQAPS